MMVPFVIPLVSKDLVLCSESVHLNSKITFSEQKGHHDNFSNGVKQQLHSKPTIIANDIQL